MRGSKRSDSDRAKVAGLALVVGAKAAAEQTGVPERTVRDYMSDPEFAELRQRTKEQVADEWWGIVQTGFRRVAHLLGDAEDIQKVATATAIVTDKMLLIRGEATSRAESKDITHDLDDATRRRITAWFDEHMDTDARPTESLPAESGAEVR